MPRVALVTALLPPAVGGTEILVWRLFRDDRDLVVVSGAAPSIASATRDAPDGYQALGVPTLSVPYPRLRGYRYGLAPLLGAASAAWLAASLVKVVRFLRQHDVEHVVSVPHQGPFALLGYWAAARLGLKHTFYILDAWQEGATGPIERKVIGLALRQAARAPRSRLAVVSPELGAHYRRMFGFDAPIWIPNPAPLADEMPSDADVRQPIVLFSGGIKPFNMEVLRHVARAIARCRSEARLVITGNAQFFKAALSSRGDPVERLEIRSGSRQEVARWQREAAVLLVATNADDRSETARGYLPGRLPEYVASARPVVVLGRSDSAVARAVSHWSLGRGTSATDEQELAALFDELISTGTGAPPPDDRRRPFLELFCRDQARHRLLGTPAPALSPVAADLALRFERLERVPQAVERIAATADAATGD